MRRKYSPLHDKWHKRVEGQIRHVINVHPKWFVFKNDADKRDCINSIAKRIVGEIVADYTMATVPNTMQHMCSDSVEGGDAVKDVTTTAGLGCKPESR